MSRVASPGAVPPSATSRATPFATSSRTRRATAVPSITCAVIGCSSGEGRQCLLPPRLGRAEVVEREHVESLDLFVGLPDVGGEPLDDLVRAVAAGDEEAPEHALLLLQELGGLADAQTAGDAQELLPVDRSGDADVHGQVDAPLLQLAGPLEDDLGVEDDLGLDVRGQGALVLERLEQELGVDGRVALGVPTDPDVGE